MRIWGLRRGGDNHREYWHQIATVAEGVSNALSTERTALPESREAFSDRLVSACPGLGRMPSNDRMFVPVAASAVDGLDSPLGKGTYSPERAPA